MASNKNPKLLKLSQSYQAALHSYLSDPSAPWLRTAHKLGARAVALGLETLDMAKLHVEAKLAVLQSITSTESRVALIQHAGVFFAEAITPIERTHHDAREVNVHLDEVVKEVCKDANRCRYLREVNVHLNVVVKALTQRSLELINSVEELKQEVARRKAAEEALRTSEETTSQLLAKSRQMQDELRHLSHDLLSAQEEERRRISRELHDVIAQTLTGINVRLAALKEVSIENKKGLQRKITSTQRLVEKSVDIVHRFARELRPSLLDDLGLIPALVAYLKGFMADTGVRTSLTAFAGADALALAQRTALYRIAQEALTNVARHAQASRVGVVIQKHGNLIRMEISDDGKGFDMSKPAQKKRLGLLGMRERIEMLGGAFSIDSAPGKATTVRVEIPASLTPPNEPPA